MLRNRFTVPALCILFIVNALLFIKIKKDTATYLTPAVSYPLGTIRKYKTTPTPAPFLPTPTPIYETRYQIQRQTNNNWETLYEFRKDYQTKIAAWKNYYFYPTNEDHTLVAHDTTTGRTQTIFNLKSDSIGNIGDIKILNNTLYFGETGYLTKGGFFSVDLTQNSFVANQIAKGSNLSLRQAFNRYWLVGGDGDSCAGWTEYWLFDPSSNTAKFITNTNFACGEGVDFIGITSQGRFVVSGFKPKENVAIEEPSGFPEQGDYTYINSVPLSTPETQIGLIPSQNMPKGITGITMVNSDDLVLVGQKIYLAKAPTYTPELIMELPQKVDRANLINYKNNIYCLQTTQGGTTSQIQLNTATKTYLDYWKECLTFAPIKSDQFYPSTQQLQTEFDQTIADIPTPDGYRLTTKLQRIN